MSLDWSRYSARAARAALLIGISMGWSAPTRAQDHTADPYKPYNQQYEQFVYPTYPTGYGLTPNQNVLEGRSGYSGANQFQRFLEEGEAGDEFVSGRRRSGPGVPYYSAYRQYDREYNRIYQPNQQTDENYYQDKNARHEKYVAYLKERDPKKRAELYRAYTSETRKVARDLSNPRPTAARRGASAKPDDRKPDGGRPRSTTGARPAANSTRATLFGEPRPARPSPKPAERTLTPSEILRESEEPESGTRSRSFTAPGLGPRSTTPIPR